MNSAEELGRVDQLIRRYEAVYRTSESVTQKERVEKELKELRSQRQKILAAGDTVPEEKREVDEAVELRHLRRLLESESRRAEGDRLEPLAAPDAVPTPAQQEIFDLMLYTRFFQREFLPFLTAKRLKLDYKFSIDRDGFYHRVKDLERKLDIFREENSRFSDSELNREAEPDMRKRVARLTGQIEADAAKLYGAVKDFCDELVEDAAGDGVKCQNGDEAIAFDGFEGRHLLEGMKVKNALTVCGGLASEVLAYLKVS